MRGNSYPVNDLYYTIQGEGVYTGVPAVFVRLHGCPVGCAFCDTKETWYIEERYEKKTLDEALGANKRHVYLSGSEINYEIKQRYPTATHVVITGGEPSLYPLKKLVAALHDGGFFVAVETSGTAIGHVDAGLDWVTVSPKIFKGSPPIEGAAIRSASEIKHVIGRQQDLDNLQALIDDFEIKDNVTICLQPMSQSEKATQLCVETAKQQNWRLSIQTHKLVNLP